MEIPFFMLIPVFALGLMGGYFVGAAVIGGAMSARAEAAEARAERKAAYADYLDSQVAYEQRQAKYWRDQYYTLKQSMAGRAYAASSNPFNPGTQSKPKPAPPPPPPPKYPPNHWRMVLGLGDGPVTRKTMTARYTLLAKTYHPDRGGDAIKMSRINVARDEALKELKA